MEKIKDTLFKFLHLDNLVGNLSGYLESRLELFKLEIREDVSRALARALVYGLIGLFGLLFLIFFSVGLAHFLNLYFQAVYTGYWIVCGIYGVIGLLFLLFRGSLAKIFEKHFVEITRRRVK